MRCFIIRLTHDQPPLLARAVTRSDNRGAAVFSAVSPRCSPAPEIVGIDLRYDVSPVTTSMAVTTCRSDMPAIIGEASLCAAAPGPVAGVRHRRRRYLASGAGVGWGDDTHDDAVGRHVAREVCRPLAPPQPRQPQLLPVARRSSVATARRAEIRARRGRRPLKAASLLPRGRPAGRHRSRAPLTARPPHGSIYRPKVERQGAGVSCAGELFRLGR